MKAEMAGATTQEQKDDPFDGKLKRTRGKLPDRGTSLTCNEASVDNILSEGEST